MKNIRLRPATGEICFSRRYVRCCARDAKLSVFCNRKSSCQRCIIRVYVNDLLRHIEKLFPSIYVRVHARAHEEEISIWKLFSRIKKTFVPSRGGTRRHGCTGFFLPSPYVTHTRKLELVLNSAKRIGFEISRQPGI